MNLYLDIDGVILTKSGDPAPDLLSFLEFVTSRFDCYWLPTHCRGNFEGVFKHLFFKVSPWDNWTGFVGILSFTGTIASLRGIFAL